VGKITFDPTVKMGDLLLILACVLGAFGAYNGIRIHFENRMTKVEAAVIGINTQMGRIDSTLITIQNHLISSPRVRKR